MLRLGTTAICALALAVIVNGIVRGSSGLLDYFRLIDTRDTMATTVRDLEDENAKLTEEIGKLKSSKSYARKVLREKYHTTEENEHIIFFAD